MPRWGPEWSKQSRLEASKTLVVGCRNPKKARGLGRRHNTVVMVHAAVLRLLLECGVSGN